MPDAIATIMGRYRNFNLNADAAPEIISLSYASFENPAEVIPANGRLALVLIEPRVLEPIPGATVADEILPRLRRFKGDLRAEGLHTRFIVADVYRGARNQDGRTVIAIRRFLQEIKAAYPSFEGVVMLGAFPEATVVWRWVWSPGFPQFVMGQNRTGKYMGIYPELVDTRTEIVLCDLTGNWEALYREEDIAIQGIIAYPDAATAARPWSNEAFVNPGEFSSNIFKIEDVTFRDCFYIDDANFSILERRDGANPLLRLRADGNMTCPECSPDDRAQPNKIARPDIVVSRINGLNVALDPNPALRGTDGRTFLDAAGNPQSVTSAANLNPDPKTLRFLTTRNALLERRLYNDYFDLNHRFRVGAFGHQPFRVGAVSGAAEFDATNYAAMMNVAANSFQAAVVKNNANLADYVDFCKVPAALRYVIAHSNGNISEFLNTATPAQIQAAMGGLPVRWFKTGNIYNPSYEGMGGTMDLFIHRAMYRNRTLSTAGASITVHGGCEVNAASGTQSAPYHSQSYAPWQNAEAILLFTNTVALLSRAKVFNDSPWGFAEGFRSDDRANVGVAFKNYYSTQARDGGGILDNAQRKRAYHWSLNGDWTVRLRNKNGLGILKLAGGSLTSTRVHPDKAWIEGWNFDRGLNTIKAIGDIDGDGLSEFLITSDWGLGIVKHDGDRWRAPLVAPRDTWFGGWRYDATVNAGRDKVIGIANVTGTANSEIILTSSWGMTSLAWVGGNLQPSFLMQNGGRIGGWLLNTADNTIAGFGNFDATSHKEVVVTSPWGLGIVSLQTTTSLVMVPNGTMLAGGWRINTADNKIVAIADFDGDGRDEIFISSPWGIGVLKVENGSLVTKAAHANNTTLSNAYVVKNTDKLWAAANFHGGATAQLLIANSGGLHVLQLGAGGLARTTGLNNGQRVGGWLLNTADNRSLSAGDFDGDGKAEVFICSPWGIGVLGLTGANFRNPTLHAFGSDLGDWCLDNTDTFIGSGNLMDAATQIEILVKK